MDLSQNKTRPQLNRRAILASFGATALAIAFPQATVAELTSHAQLEQILKPLLVTRDPGLFQFAVTVYERCLLGRVMPAEAPFKHDWLVPGGEYMGQWIWDTTFLTDLIAILPGRKEFIRGVYQNYWDFQQRWNRAKPEYAQGMLPNFIAPDSGPPGFNGKEWLTMPVFSQAPLLAWGVERVFARNRDLELVRHALLGLEAFHNWYWRERDLDGFGLITVGSYSGVVQDARFETYDNEVDLDTLKLIPHPKRPAGLENGRGMVTSIFPPTPLICSSRNGA